MHTIISIVGKSAVGKTAAALAVAQQFLAHGIAEVHLISADSRQVYKGLEILTGADVPEGFTQDTSQDFTNSYYTNGQIHLHGVSVIEPTEQWADSHFQELAVPIISHAQTHDHGVIIVGGTGLYHDHLLSEDPQLQIPPNQVVRAKAAQLSVTELQDWLTEINPEWFAGLNNSDKNNPRRLVRAIEISLTPPEDLAQLPPVVAEHRYLGLSASLEVLAARISRRVEQRFSAALAEVGRLAAQFSELQPPVRSTLGFKELLAYQQQAETDKQTSTTHWARREFQYAKRQFTWWKKRSQVTWVDTQKSDWADQVLAITKSARSNG